MTGRAFRLRAALALVLAVVGAATWAWWNYDLRWRSKLVTRHQQEISALLQQAGWVAPGLPGKKLYVICRQPDPACVRFKSEQLQTLQAKGVDTRVIEIAQRDLNGQARSTPAERATVAQLWLGRDWRLLQRWDAAPAGSWAAEGIPPADGDMARTAVVEAGRGLVDKLTPLLKDNGIAFAYPMLIWWNDKGEMRGCGCARVESWRFVRADLGV